MTRIRCSADRTLFECEPDAQRDEQSARQSVEPRNDDTVPERLRERPGRRDEKGKPRDAETYMDRRHDERHREDVRSRRNELRQKRNVEYADLGIEDVADEAAAEMAALGAVGGALGSLMLA